MKNSERRVIRIMVLVGSFVSEVLLMIVAGTWLGKKLDSMWMTHPTFTLIGVLVGIFLGFGSALYTLVRMTKD